MALYSYNKRRDAIMLGETTVATFFSKDAEAVRDMIERLNAAGDMRAALDGAVAAYGKPGGPWNVPSDPGGWLSRARAALAKANGGAS
jgi:hypothetical protein